MLSAEEQERIGRECRTLKFIWLALVISVFIYPVLGVCLQDRIFVSMSGQPFAIFQQVMYALAPLTVVMSFFLRKSMLSGKRRVAGGAASGRHPAVALYATTMVVSLALAESVGIYGFILFLIGKNPPDLYVLTFVALVLMLLYHPRQEEVFELAERLRQMEKMEG